MQWSIALGLSLVLLIIDVLRPPSRGSWISLDFRGYFSLGIVLWILAFGAVAAGLGSLTRHRAVVYILAFFAGGLFVYIIAMTDLLEDWGEAFRDLANPRPSPD